MAELPVQFEDAVEATGQDLRHAYGRPLGEGVEGYTDMLVTAGAAVTTVDVAAGIGFVRGDGLTDLGLYRCRNDATVNSAAFEAGGLAAPDATNPRLDQIIARVYDDEADSSGLHKWRLTVLKGTAKAGATLDNREGAAALPNSAMLLADVLVPAGAPAVLKAENIRDRRAFCYVIVPPLLTDVDMVPFLPLHIGFSSAATSWASSQDLHQGAVAFYLPRRIVGATKLRFKYTQSGGESLTGSYVIAIFDASGRKIVDTGAVAFAGGVNSFQVRAETIAATTFEAGVYYVFVGLDTTNTGVARFIGRSLTVETSGNPGAPAPNLGLYSATGGTTVPATLLGMTDVVSLSATTTPPPIPDIYVSVG